MEKCDCVHVRNLWGSRTRKENNPSNPPCAFLLVRFFFFFFSLLLYFPFGPLAAKSVWKQCLAYGFSVKITARAKCLELESEGGGAQYGVELSQRISRWVYVRIWEEILRLCYIFIECKIFVEVFVFFFYNYNNQMKRKCVDENKIENFFEIYFLNERKNLGEVIKFVYVFYSRILYTKQFIQVQFVPEIFNFLGFEI